MPTKDSETCPPLPTGSIDMNKLHEAAKKGEDLGEVAEKLATTRMRANAVTKPEPADGPDRTGTAAPSA